MFLSISNTQNTANSKSNISDRIYEQHLIRLLSLPIDACLRQLQSPFSCPESTSQSVSSGVKTEFYMNTQTDRLNKLNLKLNTDTHISVNERTFSGSNLGESDSVMFENACEKSLSYKSFSIDLKSSQKSRKASNITPRISETQSQENSGIVKLEDMPIQEQKKKGLLGLQFKVIKVLNPATQRSSVKYVCTFDNCQKQCENKWTFLDHNRHHTGDRPYKCGDCGKKFVQRGNLKQHKLTHSK